MVIIDKELGKIKETQDSAFTILMWDLSKDDLISELKHKLALISNIKNTHKRIKYNDRIYKYLAQVEKSSIKTHSQIVFIGSEEPIVIKLEKSDIKTLQDFSIEKFTIENGEDFGIERLIDLFENFIFYNVIVSNSNSLTHMEGNSNKKRIVEKNVSLEYLKNLNSQWFFIGKMPPQYKNKYCEGEINDLKPNPSWNEIMEKINQIQTEKNANILQEHLNKMQLNSDKFIFGNDIWNAIEQYNIQTLFLHIEKKKYFDDKIVEKDLTTNINFQIILVGKSDILASDILLKDYLGIIGIKYY